MVAGPAIGADLALDVPEAFAIVLALASIGAVAQLGSQEAARGDEQSRQGRGKLRRH